MESEIEQDKANKSVDTEINDKTTKATDATKKETAANLNYNHSQNSKTSGKGMIKNKNACLRRSKSCLEMTTKKEETMPHSESFCGRPLHSYNSQVSIQECDGEHVKPTAQYNISLVIAETSVQDDNLTTIEDNSVVHTSASLPNMQQSENKQKLGQQLEPFSQQQQQQQQQSPLHQQHQLSKQHQTNQLKIKQKSSPEALEQHHKQPNQQELLQKHQSQHLSNDKQQRKSKLHLANIPKVTSTTTEVTSTDTTIISSITAMTSTTVVTSTSATKSITSIPLQQQQPLPPQYVKQVSPEKVDVPVPAFTPPTPYMCDYSKWLPHRWHGTTVDQFQDDPLSSDHTEAEETRNNIPVGNSSVAEAFPCDIQSKLNTTVCKDSTKTVSEGSKSELSTNNLSHVVTSSSAAASASASTPLPQPPPPPLATADFKAYVPQKTPPTFTLNDFGSGEISDIENQSVSSASPDSSASPEVDYTSMQSPSFAQSSSMQSSTTRSSQSPMTSMDSSILSTKSSSSSLQSTTSPIAIISPTLSTAGPSLRKEKKSDFILLHADADQEEAQQCRDHLKQDIGIHDLTVDLFSEIDSGQTAMMSSETLHDRYNYILVLGTNNLADDKFSRFLNENILTKGLQEAKGKEDRVIPIWARSDCKHLIFEFRIIKGFQYYDFLSCSTSTKANYYIQRVKNVVLAGRKKINI